MLGNWGSISVTEAANVTQFVYPQSMLYVCMLYEYLQQCMHVQHLFNTRAQLVRALAVCFVSCRPHAAFFGSNRDPKGVFVLTGNKARSIHTP